ncbi:MAG: hypothetical protein LBG80_10945 [Bacteroidales bacterium]|jgi:hypothetical protein|nr:hypothetical protein [Bacteroidales bacterium]
MKKIAFTICSNNYVAQANVLFRSLFRTNPDYKLILGLVDKINPNIEYGVDGVMVEVVEVENLDITVEYDIFHKYNIVELNTSVKASYIKWIKKFRDADIILYFDPDIKVFSSFSIIENSLREKSIILTPHILNPIPLDDLWPNENLFLTRGIYNLGFIGVSFTDKRVFDFLDWWEERLMKQCFDYISKGLFVDQLPVTLVSVFFHEIVKVLFHYGMNAAPWNLHERVLTLKDSKYYFNNDELIFYHFSYISLKKRKHNMYNRYENYPLLEEFYEGYIEELKQNCYFERKNIECYYKVKSHKVPIYKKIISKVCVRLLDSLNIRM